MPDRYPQLDEADYGAADARPGASDWGMFFLRCALRRKLVIVLVFAAGIVATVGYFRYRSPLYRVETQLLAQRQAALPSAARGAMSDDPTNSAWEIVHRRDNLVAIVEQAQLLQSVPVPSSADRGLRRTLLSLRLGEPDDDPLAELVRLLDHRLRVTTAEGTVTIGIDWPHPQQAYAIIEGALQNFIEARHLQEVTAIDEVISVLQGRVATARKNLDQAIQQAERDAVQQRAGVPRAAVASATPSQTATEELVRVKSMLDAKQRAIQDIEDFRRRRLLELQAQLDAQRNIYSEAHPEVIRLREDVNNLSRESPQVVALRGDERKLQAQYAELLAKEGRLHSGPHLSALTAAPQPAQPGTVEENPSVREARQQHQQILDRVNAAQLELDAARAAFKFRYKVIWPPQVPTEPVSPNPVKIIGAGVIASLMMALGVAAALSLLSGRIVDRFQLERTLGLRVIAQLDRK